MSRGEAVLVVAAHPDDEILGCGGAIAWHAARGDHVQVAILAEGLTSRDPERAPDRHAKGFEQLRAAARKANEIAGAADVTFFEYPDNRMDGVERLDVTKTVEGLVAAHRPSVVYTHHAGDVNVDHRRIQDAVIAACRPLPGATVRTLLFFEVASSTEWQPPAARAPFAPNWYLDISDVLDRKLSALSAYASEMRDWPHPRSIRAVEHLARWRGATIGVEAAEAFVCGRHLPGRAGS